MCDLIGRMMVGQQHFGNLGVELERERLKLPAVNAVQGWYHEAKPWETPTRDMLAIWDDLSMEQIEAKIPWELRKVGDVETRHLTTTGSITRA